MASSWAEVSKSGMPTTSCLARTPRCGGLLGASLSRFPPSLRFYHRARLASAYWHAKSRVLLLVYVDDFKMSGPAASVSAAWTRIRQELHIGDPAPARVFLGCSQQERTLSIDGIDGHFRVMEYGMEGFLRSCLDAFVELTGDQVHHTSPTPYLAQAQVSEQMKPQGSVGVPPLPDATPPLPLVSS